MKGRQAVGGRHGCLTMRLETGTHYLGLSWTIGKKRLLTALRRFVSGRGLPANILGRRIKLLHRTYGPREIVATDGWISSLQILEHGGICRPLSQLHSSHRREVRRRFIRFSRRILTAVTKQKLPSDEIPHTLLVEAEGFLNDGLLVPVISNELLHVPLTKWSANTEI